MVNCVYVTEHCSFVSTYFAAWESERCRAAATMLGRMVASRNYPQTGFEEINLQTAFSQISPKRTSGPELVSVPSRWWYPCTALTIGDDSPNVRLGVGTHPRGNPRPLIQLSRQWRELYGL